MRRRKIKLKYKKERVLFSDVLPYEMPFIISNRYFYRFLVRNQIQIKDGRLIWGKHLDAGALDILAFLFSTDKATLESNGALNLNGNKKLIKIPFNYRILHKPTKSRVLTLIDPVNQMQMVDFYERNRSLLLYYTNLDRFSLRHPSKVACYFYYKDRLHHTLLGRKTDKVELFFHEYENLRTYFSYERYSNIYKFYEDYRYQRAEKKFQHMLKFDIQSCFDNIYTHSISWAVGGGRDSYKEHYSSNDNTFASEWDKLMELMNYNETNGIVIGPEFSRIFAEVILQHIDNRVTEELRKKKYIFNRDFVCYRYVDDYFFFYNDDAVRDFALVAFTNYLKEFKLNISSEKTKLYERPFITEITRAKIELDKLIDDALKYHDAENTEEEPEDSIDEQANENEEETEQKISKEAIEQAVNDKSFIHFNASAFNKNYKAIQVSMNVASKDIINYSLARISRRLESTLKKFDKTFKVLCKAASIKGSEDYSEDLEQVRIKKEKMLSRFLLGVLDSVFFLYSTNKRVNTTLKVLMILHQIIIMLDNDYIVDGIRIPRFSDYIRDFVFKKIQDEIGLVFQTSKLNENTQLETLYFLVILKELRSKYDLPPYILELYLGVERDDKGVVVHYPQVNAISIIILLYYFGNREKYSQMKDDLLQKVYSLYEQKSVELRKQTTELRVLALDLLACPYIEVASKKKIAGYMMIPNDSLILILRYFKRYKFMFTKWTGVDVTKELNAKISQEVYA